MLASKYIDIHTHILPGVDDGSASMEETVQMLKMAYEQGVGAIIATPHYAVGTNNMTVEELERIRDKVQEEASKIDADFKIYLGNELLYSDSVIDDLLAKKALTLAGSRYALVEFLPGVDYKTLFKAVVDFCLAGFIPVLAHAERYRCLYYKEELISDLIDAGCYIQMNATSLSANIFTNPEAYHNAGLVKRGLVHFIGSDCHDVKGRKPDMQKAVKLIEKKCGRELAHQLYFNNPVKILENTYI